MRITGGLARGILLETPKNSDIRPATDLLRGSIFSFLGDVFSGSSFVDLFGGIGSYGLEAISRGATSGIWVEKNPVHAKFIESNRNRVCKSAQQNSQNFSVLVRDAFLFFKNNTDAIKPKFLFLDPPYTLCKEKLPELLSLLENFLANSPETTIIWEMPSDLKPELPKCFELCRVLGKLKGKENPKAYILKKCS